MEQTHSRILGLDLLRAIAIVLVVLAHSCGLLGPLMHLPYLGRAVAMGIDHSQPIGALGVELFFILSGFLIGNILIKTFITEDFSFSLVKQFWVRRWFRTLPNYWLILSVNIIVYQHLNLQPFTAYQIMYYPFLQNLWYPNHYSFFNESWSLSIEEWFYLTLPIVLLSCRLLFKVDDKRKFLLRIFTGYLLFFVLIRVLNAFHPINDSNQDIGIRKVVLFRLDAVMFGVLWAYQHVFNPAFFNKFRSRFLIFGVFGIGSLYFLMSKRDLHFTNSSDRTIRFLSDAFLYLLLPLFFSMMLPAAYGLKTTGIKKADKIIRFISRISYSMYLIHFSLIFLPFFYELKTSPLAALCLYFSYWIIVIILSYALFRFFEMPIMRLRNRF